MADLADQLPWYAPNSRARATPPGQPGTGCTQSWYREIVLSVAPGSHGAVVDYALAIGLVDRGDQPDSTTFASFAAASTTPLT
jgi:hypothetical protein